jgi:hypothetical protein
MGKWWKMQGKIQQIGAKNTVENGGKWWKMQRKIQGVVGDRETPAQHQTPSPKVSTVHHSLCGRTSIELSSRPMPQRNTHIETVRKDIAGIKQKNKVSQKKAKGIPEDTGTEKWTYLRSKRWVTSRFGTSASTDRRSARPQSGHIIEPLHSEQAAQHRSE